jgi:hypothetical protein
MLNYVELMFKDHTDRQLAMVMESFAIVWPLYALF